MSSQTYRLWIATSLVIGSLSLSPVARSQIVPDTTLPNDSISAFQDNIWTINGGTAAGSNLFHSFSDFSLPTNTTAHFNNALTIENIITRVTGGNISNIDGLLRANGTANLFLLNPNGIVFGPNARLDIGGSFVGSTADQINFADGSSFSATDSATAPLLTVSVPIGLQMGANPGAIEVNGPGHGMSFVEETFSSDRENRTLGLQVRPGRTLALLGGHIDLLGGNLTAIGDAVTGEAPTAGGRIELGSVAANSPVSLNPIAAGWQLGYEVVSAFQDIRLLDAASIDTSGAGAGAIHLQGRSILVRDGSGLVAFNLGAQPSAPITVRAIDLVEFSGFAANDSYQSSILAKVNPGATGQGSDIDVQADRLQLLNGGTISGATLGPGNVGSLTVRASEVVIQGGRFRIEGTVRNDDASSLGTQVTPSGTGRGGDVLLEADRVLVSDRAGISSTTIGVGDAGNVTIRARESVEVRERASIQASVIGLPDPVPLVTGQGGVLSIYTDRLLITSGANLRVSTAAAGDAGSVFVQARDILVQGQADLEPTMSDPTPDPRLSAIGSISTTAPRASGGAGDITIHTEYLRVEDGGQITASTNTRGDAGNLTIMATDIVLSGRSSKQNPRSSGLFAQVARPQATGNGGALRIETDRLTVQNGADISTTTNGRGNAGPLTILARESLILSNSGGIGATANLPVPHNVNGGGGGTGGNGGDIRISTNFLQLIGGGAIASTTKGSGQAGNINIEAGEIQLIGEEPMPPSNRATRPRLSRIEASTINTMIEDRTQKMDVFVIATGGGGDITIQADRFVATDGGRVRTSTESSGNAGDIAVSAETVELSGTSSPRNPRPSGLFAVAEEINNVNTIGNGGGITLEVDRLDVSDGANVSVSSEGDGSAGDLQIDAEQIRLDRGFLNADTNFGDRGNILLNVSDLRLRNGSGITTNSDSANGGNIAIESDTIVALEDSDISANARQGNGGQVKISTQGLFGTAFRLQLTPASDITATSDLSPELNGEVLILTPDVDPSSGLVKLPETLLDVSQLISDRLCRVGTRSSFSIPGRGGMPPGPGEEPMSEILDEPIVRHPSPTSTPQTTSTISAPQPHESFIEARGWTIGDRGEVILTASPVGNVAIDPSGDVSSIVCP
jgi:filamentous hemagglutinin family protein